MLQSGFNSCNIHKEDRLISNMQEQVENIVL